MATEGDDEDEFWQLALHPNEKEAFRAESDSDGEETSRSITYNVPWKGGIFPLKLSPLPDRDGIWSPLGAQAWHASSLLVAYLLQHLNIEEEKGNDASNEEKPRSLLSQHLDSWLADSPKQSSFTALELGSGAVGLAGIVLGLLLGEHLQRPPTVILTDNEPNVLRNLQKNVHQTLDHWKEKEIDLPNFRVEHLDWNDYSSHQHTSSLQLVIGSELVYTQETTAHACAQVVLSILHQHPDVLVFILQVTDRDGWKNVFLPALRGHADIKVVEEPMEDFSLHQVGSQLIPPGGTLDRFAFGGCFIFSKSSLLVKK